MFTTYILYSDNLKRYYTGQTEDLERRLSEHNRGKTSGMKSGIPWRIVFRKDFLTRNEAVQLEMEIKKRGAGRFLSDIGSSSVG
jgi:putative endonuclease